MDLNSWLNWQLTCSVTLGNALLVLSVGFFQNSLLIHHVPSCLPAPEEAALLSWILGLWVQPGLPWGLSGPGIPPPHSVDVPMVGHTPGPAPTALWTWVQCGAHQHTLTHRALNCMLSQCRAGTKDTAERVAVGRESINWVEAKLRQ